MTTIRKPTRLYTKREEAEIWALYRKGMMIKEIAQLVGRSFESVKTKVAYLRAENHQYTEGGPYAGVRHCLKCRTEFFSEHKRQNQICGACKNSDAWRNGVD